MYIWTMNNEQHNNTMNNATTTNDFTATLTPKMYAIEATYDLPVGDQMQRMTNVRLNHNGQTAFVGGFAKTMAAKWTRQAKAKGINIVAVKFVKL